MSHEAISYLWSALYDLSSLSAGLRDTVGNFILQACRSEYHPLDTPQRFLEYALELGVTFDVIRCINKADHQASSLLQDDLISSVAHFLIHTANDFGTSQSLLTDAAYIQVLGQTICSAVFSLQDCAWNCRSELRSVLYRAAKRLLTNAPSTDIRLWYVQTLAHYLCSHYGPDPSVHASLDQSNIDWKMLWEANSEQRAISIAELADHATDSDIATTERILPLLNLCQLYWDTDVLMIQAGIYGPRRQSFSKLFSTPDDFSAMQLALEVRFIIQEQLSALSVKRTPEVDSLKTQSHILFKPGLSLPCAQDICNCTFHPRLSEHILGMRYTRQSDIVRADLAKNFNNSAVSQLPLEFSTRTYRKYAERIKRKSVAEPPSPDETLRQTTGRTKLQDAEEYKTGNRVPLVTVRSISQPEILRPLSRPQTLLTSNSANRVGVLNRIHSKDETSIPENTEEMLVTVAERKSPNAIRAGSNVPYSPSSCLTPAVDTSNLAHRPRVLSIDQESCTQSPGSQSRSPASGTASSGALRRADSSTTATSSSKPGSHSAYSYTKSMTSEPRIHREGTVTKAFNESNHLMTVASLENEKVYPEVVTMTIAGVEPDGLSLFSEENAGQIPARSIYTPSSNKKWNPFKSTRRAGSPFVTPKVRFFASGKHMIAWTRYGGGIYDLSSEESLFSPLHVPEIVLASAGTVRYAILARSEEGFSLCVNSVNQAVPVLRLGLKHQPAAIDVSRDDRFVAVKYAHVVKILDLQAGTQMSHQLPREEGKVGPSGHSVSFAHDSSSFVASTRLGPEKVHSYWSYCMDPNRSVNIQSSAPCGHVDDHGLTSLNVCGPSVRSVATAFLGTFTEKGHPVVLAMNQSSPPRVKSIPDPKGLLGTRIQHADMFVEAQLRKCNLVLVNQNNDVFWITNLFGSDQEVKKVRTLKRPKGMKPEVLVSMTGPEEANLFWIEKGSSTGTLVKVGKGGGMTKPVELRLDCEPMCAA